MTRPMKMFSRARLAALAVTASLALAGCNGQNDDTSARSRQPLSAKILSIMSEKDMAPQSPILVRVFKEEAELEVWKTTGSGTYALLKTYPICRWSGELGPKVKVGDRQAPEGFYNITPGLLNPNSNYYLAINTGFPNAFDKSYGRTGDFLMIHGDCSSSGCYAMTDEQIAEIYALARESLAGGQRSFQIQAMPFRMTPENMARHRNNPNMAFWRNLKQGYDHFEVTHLEPKVNVCGRQYVFDAQPPAGQAFEPSLACPNYTVPDVIASAVSAKQRSDDAKAAALAPSTPLAPIRTGKDGGMNPVFLAKFQPETAGDRIALASAPLPGTIPPHARPPKTDEEVALSNPALAQKPATLATRPGAPDQPVQAAASGSGEARVANADTGLSFGKMLGFAGAAPQAPAAQAVSAATSSAPSAAAAPTPRTATAVAAGTSLYASKPATAMLSATPAPSGPRGTDGAVVQKPTQTASADTGAAQASVLMGAVPIVTPGTFGN